MSNQSIADRIVSAISYWSSVGEDAIKREHDLAIDLGLCEMDRVQVLFDLEDEFRMELDGEFGRELIEDSVTVGQVIDYFINHTK